MRLCLLAVAVLAPGAAGAQTTTADGARALVRGDYETALRILRPLAENTSQPDPLAQSFLAMLYASHRGGADPIRTCGLYLAAATGTNPLASQSLALARATQRESVHLAQLCAERTAPDYHSLPSTSFTLGPDHRLTIDGGGAIVSYNGTEKRTPMSIGGVGAVYLPLRYTVLDVSLPRAMRRHFIQIFSWSREGVADQTAWNLHWVLFEVVGTDFRPVAGSGLDSVMSITAPQPPAVDVETLGQVRVGTNGEVEWILLTEPPRRGLILSERQR